MTRDRLMALGFALLIVILVVAEEVRIRQLIQRVMELATEPAPPVPTPEEAGDVVRRAEEIARGD